MYDQRGPISLTAIGIHEFASIANARDTRLSLGSSSTNYGLNGTANDLRSQDVLRRTNDEDPYVSRGRGDLSFGVGSAHADSGEDGGTIANTLFTTLPGIVAIAPG
jgi:hypothetical protein